MIHVYAMLSSDRTEQHFRAGHENNTIKSVNKPVRFKAIICYEFAKGYILGTDGEITRRFVI
jgi:apolipoprotein N-acyltransferase